MPGGLQMDLKKPQRRLTLGSLKVAKVHTCTTAKRIEKIVVGQVWSGIKFATKPDHPGLSSSIRLEVIEDKRKILVRSHMRFSYRLPNRNQELCSYVHSF